MISKASPGPMPRSDAETSRSTSAPPDCTWPDLTCSTNSSHDPISPDTRYTPSPAISARRATWSTFGPPHRYTGSLLRKKTGRSGSLEPRAYVNQHATWLARCRTPSARPPAELGKSSSRIRSPAAANRLQNCRHASPVTTGWSPTRPPLHTPARAAWCAVNAVGARYRRRVRHRKRWASALACAGVALAACSSGGGPASPAAPPATTAVATSAPAPTTPASTAASAGTGSAPAPATPWPTYNGTNDRTGLGTGVPRPAALRAAWAAPVDGAVYGQPIVVGTTVIAATENDSVYAFDLATGAVRWRSHLGTPMPSSGLPCGDISPLGITGTPAYDQLTGSVVVVESTGGAHDLVALDASSGATRWRANLDVGGHNRVAEQQRGALAVANGRVYAPFGGLYGDCGDYVGYITATPTSGTGTTTHYAVPTAREGGMWAASGPAVAPDGTVYVAVGNGASTGGPYDGSDSVLRLSPDLSSRLDFFAPAAWAEQNATDTDLGSTGPLLVAGGLLVQSGKDGNVYVLDA